jgi:ribosomal protein S18 acetylase RimI-like enzyme
MLDHPIDPLESPAAPEPAAASPSNSGNPAPEGARKPRRSWVPVRSLSSRHRDRILAHLLELDERDRYLRFGFAASDAQISHYADAIDFERDEVFGVFNRRLQLIAMAHLAYAPAPQARDPSSRAEFGASVSRQTRGQGLGSRLFEHAILHSRNRGIETLFIHALSENTAMLRIARNAGATVERDGSESEAWLKLPPEDLASQLSAMVEGQAAEWDYRLKAQAKRVYEILDAVSEVGANIAGSGRDPPK